VDAELKRLADSAMEPPPARPRAELADADADALRLKLRDPAERLGAIRELCLRGHPAAMEELFQVLPELPSSELAVAVAQLLSFGEAVGDRLILCLSAPSQELRQAAALGLGRLKLRRALAPLLRQLDQESTECWTEIARSLGEFGPSALRTVARAVQGARNPERFVQALAHLANHGSARDVEILENDPDMGLADAARRAMARRSRMEWEDLAIREGRTLTENTAPARFSKVFYAEVAKVDI
jgi:HEAT repeat protein